MQLELFEDYNVMPVHRVVGFCGAKGHGKDTAAAVLVDELKFEHLSFATGLRRTVCTALRVNECFFTNPETKEEIDPRTGKPRRYWLQWIGTEGFRTLWNDVWVDWWTKEIEERALPRVVSTDVRFPNELEAVRRFKDSLMIRVVNPNKEDSGDKHASEAYYRDFAVDYEILNDGSIEDLQSKVRAIVQKHFDIAPLPNRSIEWENI